MHTNKYDHEKLFSRASLPNQQEQETGLGLSLAYDIIKAHDGEIKVKEKEDERSEFIIQLPTNTAS